jgi:hypothetical protein
MIRMARSSIPSEGDLVATVRDIISHERANAPLLQLNVAETDPRINPQDHSDHLMTARVALDAVTDMRCVRRVYYVDYASSKLPENLNAQERDMQSAVYAVTLAGVMAFDHGTAWQHYDQSFIGRNYYRVDEPNERCEAAPTIASGATEPNKGPFMRPPALTAWRVLSIVGRCAAKAELMRTRPPPGAS